MDSGGEMASIPESLTCLKRASLQRLCKRIGVKANGKVRFLPNTKTSNEP